jgi:hypothetical protein
MEIVGGTMSGNCSTDNDGMDTAPSKVITKQTTQAKIGRSIKKWENMVQYCLTR